MVFSSYGFLFIFLPITLALYYAAERVYGLTARLVLLTGASIVFYAYWRLSDLAILIGSIAFNFAAGGLLIRLRAARPKLAKGILAVAISGNLTALIYYKYAFFLSNAVGFANGGLFANIILPLGISFFTFTQIAYLVDIVQGKVNEWNFVKFITFVTFFPHLIAGPIIHYRDVMPQFSAPGFQALLFAQGWTFFGCGLFKKLVIADGLAPNVTAVFDAAEKGAALSTADAWSGALSYAMQLYFDFSGYSEMAIGLGLMLGVRLPVNFYSPYQATSIIDFWRRWHITLATFLRDYLYIPLGGNRRGPARRYTNLMIVMLVGGAWHGAGWTFVVWGALHGFYLIVNHGWRALAARNTVGHSRVTRFASWLLTILAVVVGWVIFRAQSLDGAMVILKAMAGLGHVQWGWASIQPTTIAVAPMLVFAMAVAFLCPNIIDVMRYREAEPPRMAGRLKFLEWRPTYTWAAIVAGVTCWAVLSISEVNTFLYFNF